ncbi:MAG TPA: signal peptidase II [Streptosporangiaceae bacterium]
MSEPASGPAGDPVGDAVGNSVGGLAAGRPRTGRKLAILLAVALVVLALDVVSKVIVVGSLPHHPPIRLLGGLLTLLLLRNSGAAFSIGTSMTIVFTVIAAAVIFYILRTARNLQSLPWAITLGLLLGGAMGNLADRIFRAPGLFRGDVVDWIELPHWPVFNLADSAIVCGGVIAVLLASRGMHLDGTRDRARRDGDSDKDGAARGGSEARGGTEGRDDGAGPALSAGARRARWRAARRRPGPHVRPVAVPRRRADR